MNTMRYRELPSILELVLLAVGAFALIAGAFLIGVHIVSKLA